MITMKVNEFKPEEWIFDRQSGYEGYRNTSTGEWCYAQDYHLMTEKLSRYEYDKAILDESWREYQESKAYYRDINLNVFNQLNQMEKVMLDVMQMFLNKKYDLDDK